MIDFPKNYRISPDFDNETWLIHTADQILTGSIPHITDVSCPRSQGTIHDFYSEGDYWWPDPAKPDGLPYVRRDGETNPDNFTGHRIILRQMRTNVVVLTCAWKLTGNETYAQKATQTLKEFFLDHETCMAPHLSYAQAIAGVCRGRGIGIIDTLHLIDIPFAIQALLSSAALSDKIYLGLKNWFSAYLGWMLTSAEGIDEMNTENNHCICFCGICHVYR